MHVLDSVLRKVHAALTTGGSVLITQPATAEELVELEIDGRTQFSEVLEAVNFARYLKATLTAINYAVGTGLFEIENEATTPTDGTYHSKAYGSVDEWVDNQIPTSGDEEALDAMASRLRDVAQGRQHRVLKSRRDHAILLRKS